MYYNGGNNRNSSNMFADYDPYAYDGQTQSGDHSNYKNDRRSQGYGSRGGRTFQNSGNRYNDQNSQKVTMYIDGNKVGKLIGKGGSKIRELQEISNAKISVNKTGTTTVPVDIIGTPEAQEKAKQLIMELLNDGPPPSSNYSQGWNPEEQSQETEQKEVIDFDNFDWTKAVTDCEQRQKIKWSKFPPVIKNFYEEDPVVASMTEEYVAQLRLSNNNTEAKYMFDEGENKPENLIVPNPVETFLQAFTPYPDILEEIRKQGFEKPSPIQCQAWPVLLSGKDLIGIAQTGTGKTLAFLLPALIHIDGQETPREQRTGPTALILAPTRELALQIKKEVCKYSYHGIKAVCLYGGGNRKEQISVVKKGIEIVIATPGRLNDLIEIEALDVSSVSYLVLDEADRMLDMGFEPQIKNTLMDIRPDRQTVMTSATWPQGVRRLAGSYMQNPVHVCIGSLDLAAVHTVTQKIYIVEEEEKLDVLYDFFREMSPDDKVIVFIGKKTRVDHIASELALQRVNCQSIHGGRDQSDREQALVDLKSGYVRILLATDVASRGLDIEDISHVFNYDFPRDIEEYVHRVGRTGRAGKTGESITLMTRSDWSHAKDLIKILEEASQEVPEEVYKMAERHEAWKEKRARERELERSDARGYSGGGRGGGGGRSGRSRYRDAY